MTLLTRRLGGALLLLVLALAGIGTAVPTEALSVPAPAPAAALPATGDVRVLDVVLGSDGTARVVAERVVDRAPAEQPLPDQQVASVEVGLASGEVLRREAVVSGVLRAEFPAVRGSTTLSPTRVAVPDPVVHVAVPADAAVSRLTVRTASGSFRASGVRPPARPAAQRPTRVSIPGYPLGPSANRLDIVVLGDGYTKAQKASFVSHAKTLVDAVFSIEPYKSYRDFVNVVGLFAPSKQSGADQPGYVSGCSTSSENPAPSCCPDPTAPTTSSYVNTRYDSTYCSYGIAQRLLTPVDYGKVYADAAAYPRYDQVLVSVNAPSYGGSGGIIAAASADPFAPQVMQHELGHSLLGLDDEYSDPQNYPPCSDLHQPGVDPCDPNVTDQTNRNGVKWKRWFEASTPVPTTTAQPASVVGLFLGAHYSPDTWYRPCYDCLMRTLDRPMGAVESEQLPLRLFARGAKGFGVELVDPGSTKPPTGPNVVLRKGAKRTFQARVLSTRPGKGTRFVWRVDGKAVKQGTARTGKVSFTFTGDRTGHKIQLVVQSRGLLHPDKVGVSRLARTWRVTTAR